MKEKYKVMIMLVVVFFIADNRSAVSQMAVFDGTQFAQMIKEFNAIVEQITVITEARDYIEDTSQAIGEVGNVILPYTNAQNIKSQLLKDAQCLIPNIDDLYGLDFKDAQFTICDRQLGYKQGLAIDPTEIVSLKRQQIIQLQDRIIKRRENILFDAAANGLAQYDIGIKTTEELTANADDIERNLTACQTIKCIETMQAQALTSLIRVKAQQNQILLQQLKIQAGFAVATGVGPIVDAAEPADSKKVGG